MPHHKAMKTICCNRCEISTLHLQGLKSSDDNEEHLIVISIVRLLSYRRCASCAYFSAVMKCNKMNSLDDDTLVENEPLTVLQNASDLSLRAWSSSRKQHSCLILCQPLHHFTAFMLRLGCNSEVWLWIQHKSRQTLFKKHFSKRGKNSMFSLHEKSYSQQPCRKTWSIELIRCNSLHWKAEENVLMPF